MVLCVTISQCFGPFLRLKSKNCNIETIVIMHFYNRPMKREYLTVSDRLTLNDYMFFFCYNQSVFFWHFLRLKSENYNIETIVIMYFYNRPMKREYLTVSDRLTSNDYMVLCYTGAVPVLSWDGRGLPGSSVYGYR